jgi:hypothetical protein
MLKKRACEERLKLTGNMIWVSGQEKGLIVSYLQITPPHFQLYVFCKAKDLGKEVSTYPTKTQKY